ncbi:MAG: putative colanic acid biosynthesis acetyltransferase WcaF [Psychroserpens sp.]|jgi:putative colanic acid biosynthesis acetyltransferase WcaF
MKYQDLFIFLLPFGFRGASALKVQVWWLIQSTLFGLSPQFMYKWRNILLRLFGAKICKGVIIIPTVRFTYPWKLIIGDNTWVGDNVDLYILAEISIGKNAVIGAKSLVFKDMPAGMICIGNPAKPIKKKLDG